jgi:hypothetical protein
MEFVAGRPCSLHYSVTACVEPLSLLQAAMLR